MEGLEMARKRSVTWAAVYLVQFGEFVKVGITNDPASRLKVLQTGLPDEISMPFYEILPTREHAVAIERRMHQALAPRRTRGEWFRVGLDEAMEAYEAISPTKGKPVVSMPMAEVLRLSEAGALGRHLKRAFAQATLALTTTTVHGE
jgi:hypothetical protein